MNEENKIGLDRMEWSGVEWGGTEWNRTEWNKIEQCEMGGMNEN